MTSEIKKSRFKNSPLNSIPYADGHEIDDLWKNSAVRLIPIFKFLGLSAPPRSMSEPIKI